jgi:hypothetical protein|tara:strand:- start:529 stop:705 length:177 start_codon:yes stop_codon:yes gene_type:complete
MTELKQDHFEVIDSNKQKAYEEQKQMRREVSDFVLNCPKFKLFKLYDEYKRIKRDKTE